MAGSFLDDLLGSGFDDPRTAAINAVAGGLMRRDLGGGFLAANAAYAQAKQAQDRQQMQQLQMKAAQMGLDKSGLELKQMQDIAERNQRIRNRLAGDNTGGQPQTAQPDAPSLSTPELGGMPMFSQGTSSTQPAPQSAPPSAPVSGGARGMVVQQLMRNAQAHILEGDPEGGTKILEQATKLMPEVHKIEVAMQDGKPVNVITFKDGTQTVSAFGAKPDIQLENLGNRTLAIDKNQAQNGQAWQRGMTPGEQASNALGWANNAVSRQNQSLAERRFASEESTPQYIQTDAGLVAVPKRPGQGPIQGQAVMGADGQPLTNPLKQLPPAVNTAIIANKQSLGQIDRALSLLDGKDVSGMKGDTAATGIKGYLPNGMLNRLDPKGVDARAEISDIGSLKIHDRSGAAVTISESPRLMPFVPLSTDDAPTVKKKLARLRLELANEQNAMQQTYSKDQGYRPSPVFNGQGGGWSIQRVN